MRYSEDIRDCEREADILELTPVRAETGREQRPRGEDASSILRSVSARPQPPAPTGEHPGLRQLKEAH